MVETKPKVIKSKIKLIKCHPAKLTQKQFTACRLLSFRSQGDLFYNIELGRCLPKDKSYKVYMLVENDKLIAWGLTKPFNKNIVAGFYTRAAYRKRGYGSIILKEMNKDFGKIEVVPHDPNSAIFFKKNRALVKNTGSVDSEYNFYWDHNYYDN